MQEVNSPQVLMTSDAISHLGGAQSDCDCDCSIYVDFKRQVQWIALDELSGQEVLKVNSQIYRRPLVDGYELFFNPFSNEGPLVLAQAASRLLDRFYPSRSLHEVLRQANETTYLTDYKLIQQFVALGLLSRLGTTSSACFPVPQTLIAWLHLTDRCNLRCSYCYLPHVREDMSSETGRAAIDAIFRSAKCHNFEQIKIKYAGGEPLLRYSLILELHDYALSKAEENSLTLGEVVLSNGTLLTNEIAKTVKTLGLRLMISLDGYGAYHDSHRPYAGGRGSFKDVAHAVDMALSNGLVPNISVTISGRTAEGLPEVMSWILERDLPFSLNFYRENELSASYKDMQLDEQKIITGMLAAFKVIENNLPRRPFLAGIIDRANLSSAHTHTCGVGQNYLVFDQHGQVAKCQMHIRKPITNMHVEDPLTIIRTDLIGIQNISVDEKEGCKTCEWKYWCAGGCPLATHRATGRYDIKSPNCGIYKELYPEALRLEGLRLLKHQDNPKVVMRYS